MKTLVTRISLTELAPPLDTRIMDECDLRAGAGFTLVSVFPVQTELVMIFQKAVDKQDHA